jgi:hypothetical protein
MKIDPKIGMKKCLAISRKAAKFSLANKVVLLPVTTGGSIMAIFQFQAVNSKTGGRIKADVWLGGTNRGFTKLGGNEWLTVTTSQSGKYEWYAKYDGKKIDSGTSDGGKILITYTPE